MEYGMILGISLFIFFLAMRTKYLIDLKKKGYGSPLFVKNIFSEPYGKVKKPKGYQKTLLKLEIWTQFLLIGVGAYLLLGYLRVF